MKKFFCTLILFLLTAAPSFGGGFSIQAKNMYPGTEFVGDCALKAPTNFCCTNNDASDCNSQPCYNSADCVTGSYTFCSVVNGDNGYRCCIDASATDCMDIGAGGNTPDKLCSDNSQCANNLDCTANNLPFDCCTGNLTGTCNTVATDGYDTCYRYYPNGSELPFPKWECDEAVQPSIFMDHVVPTEMNGAELTCLVQWNTRGQITGGNGVFKLRAIAIKDYTSAAKPSLDTTEFPTITDAISLHPYWRNVSSEVSFDIQDAATGVACAGTACRGKILRIELVIDDATSLVEAEPLDTVVDPRISSVDCRYP